MEPLIDQWYAWTMLVSPHTGSLILANQHLRMLDSYLRHPEHHRRMAASMNGGAFVDLDPATGVPAVRELVARTRSRSAAQLELADAIGQLGMLCRDGAGGASLEALYGAVPESLKGCVEFGYDAYNHLTPRYFEQALYRSPAYAVERQSVLLCAGNADERPFILSTPRFADDRSLELPLAFDSGLLDRLFAMRLQPGDPGIVDELCALAGGTDAAAQIVSTWFTDEAPQARPPRCAPGEVKVRYFNHATLLFSTDRVHVLTDPIVPYGGPGAADRWTFADLPAHIDYVVLTHNHQDHVVLETLLQLRHRIGTVVVPAGSGGFLQDPSLRRVLQAVGFPRVVELEAYDTLETADVVIAGLPFLGEHGDLHIATKLTYLLRFGDQKFFVGADANNLEPACFDQARREFGAIDTVFIGMECKGAPMSWLYGPLVQAPLTRSQDESRRLNGSNAKRALALVASLGAKRVHVYAMGAEPWLRFISSISYDAESLPIVESDRLVRECRERGIESSRLFGSAEISFTS